MIEVEDSIPRELPPSDGREAVQAEFEKSLAAFKASVASMERAIEKHHRLLEALPKKISALGAFKWEALGAYDEAIGEIERMVNRIEILKTNLASSRKLSDFLETETTKLQTYLHSFGRTRPQA